MPSLDPIQTSALLGAMLLLVTWLWLRRRQSGAPRPSADDRPDTVADWPPQTVRVLTLPEHRAHELLRRALPRGHLLFAQVPLGRFVAVPPVKPHDEWMRRVGRMSVDLLVCDPSSRPVAAVQVHSADEGERARQRHERMQRVLRAAGLPVHVWRADALPSAAEVRRLLTPADEPAAPQFDRAGRTRLPVPEIEELLAAGERTSWGHAEPVPSAFFDDTDAVAAQR